MVFRLNPDKEFRELQRLYTNTLDYDVLLRLRASAKRQGICLHEDYRCSTTPQQWVTDREYDQGPSFQVLVFTSPERATQIKYALQCNQCSEFFWQEIIEVDAGDPDCVERFKPHWCRKQRPLIRCSDCGGLTEKVPSWRSSVLIPRCQRTMGRRTLGGWTTYQCRAGCELCLEECDECPKVGLTQPRLYCINHLNDHPKHPPYRTFKTTLF